MSAVLEIGRGEFGFCAAHTGLHADGFEPLHGHTFTVVLRLGGDLAAHGMVTDFGPVKAALREVIAPLRRRTLVATAVQDVTVQTRDGRVRFGHGDKFYDLPAGDVALLPTVNTTTEALAAYLLEQVIGVIGQCVGVDWMELTLAEAPDVAAAVRLDLR